MIHYLLLPYIAGLLLADGGYAYLQASGQALLIAASLLLTGAYGLHRWGKERGFLSCLALAMMSFGAAAMVGDRNRVERVAWAEDERTYCVEHLRKVDAGERTYRVVGLVDGVSVELSLECDTTSVVPHVGDAVLVSTALHIPRNSGNPGEFDYAAWKRRQGIAATGYCEVGKWQVGTTDVDKLPLSVRLLKWREVAVAQLSEHLQGSVLGIVAAMALGDKSYLDGATRALFSDTGTSHILALSGLHLSILCGFLMLVLTGWAHRQSWTYRVLMLLGLVAIWLFVGLAGAPISLVRAATMLSVMQLCRLCYRESSSFNNLALAAMCILLVSPQALFDLGFQLSFAAVAGILLMTKLRRSFSRKRTIYEVVERRWWQRAADFLVDWMWVSLAAQLATLPLVAYYFKQVPVYGLLANFVAIPMAYVLLLSAVVFFALPFAQTLVGAWLSLAVGALCAALAWMSEWAGATIAWGPTLPTVVACYGVMIALAWHVLTGRKGRLALFGVGVSGLVLALTAGDSSRPQAEPSIWVYNERHGQAVHAVCSRDVSYLWTDDAVRTEVALRSVRKQFWDEVNLRAPIYIMSDTLVEEGGFCGQVMQMGVRRVARVGYYKVAPLPGQVPQQPLAVDVLVVQRGATKALDQLLNYYAPQCLVLDASLSQLRRGEYVRAADSLGVACHDVSRDGAFFLPLRNEEIVP